MSSIRVPFVAVIFALGFLARVAECDVRWDLRKGNRSTKRAKKKHKKRHRKDGSKKGKKSKCTKSEMIDDKPFDDVIAFGDSIFDSGNLNSRSPDSFPLKFTTNYGIGTKVFPEYLADMYGIELNFSGHLVNPLPPYDGNNFAISGARSTPADFPDFSPTDNFELRVPVQVQTYLGSVEGHANPDALYLVSSGGNDVLDGLNKILDMTNTTEEMIDHMQFAAFSLAQSVLLLIVSGAKFVLVSLLIDVGKVPLYTIAESPFPSAIASQLTDAFNSFLEEEIRKVECQTGIDVMVKPQVDVAELGVENGFNADSPCVVAVVGLPFADPPILRTDLPVAPYEAACFVNDDSFKEYAFWDEAHVNTQVHELFAMGAFDLIEEALGQKKFPKLRGKKKKCGRVSDFFAWLGCPFYFYLGECQRRTNEAQEVQLLLIVEMVLDTEFEKSNSDERGWRYVEVCPAQ